MSENLKEMFNVSNEEFTNESKGGVMFKPTAEAGRNNEYNAIIRFIPWYKDKGKSLIRKRVCYLEHPLTGDREILDVDSNSQLSKVYFDLRDNKDARLQAHADNFKSPEKLFAIVQVLANDAEPDTVGQLLVWEFGYTIKQKFLAEEKGKGGLKPIQPFDLFKGRPFSVTVNKKGGYNNYEGCKFVSWGDIANNTPKYIGPNGEELDITNEDDMVKYFEFLKEESPDLSKFEMREWTDAQHEFVQDCIQAVYKGESSAAVSEGIQVDEKKTYKKTKTKSKSKPKSKDEKEVENSLEEDLQMSKKNDSLDDELLDSGSDDEDKFDDEFEFDDDDFDV